MGGFESNVTDYFDSMQKKLHEKSLDDAKALAADLEKYKSIEECSDDDFKEMQAHNRYLTNQVERLNKEIRRLKQ